MKLFFRFLTLAIAALVTVEAMADPVATVSGLFTPGALIQGETSPGNVVSHDGKEIRVSADGHFVLGLARNASGSTTLKVQNPAGETASFDYEITPRAFDIQRIDGLPSNQVSPDAATIERTAAEGALIRKARGENTVQPHFLSGFMWPLTGRISGVFGSQRILNGEPRSPHNGVDIAAPSGTPIHAMSAGRVSLVHQDMFYTGKTVILDHGHGLTSIYIHMSDILVQNGEVVAKGQAIGEVGQTGRATGPHLHWGVTLLSTHLDPVLVAGPMPSP